MIFRKYLINNGSVKYSDRLFSVSHGPRTTALRVTSTEKVPAKPAVAVIVIWLPANEKPIGGVTGTGAFHNRLGST